MIEKPTREELVQRVEALEKSERKYRHLFETAMVGIYRIGIEDGKFLAANESLAKMLGYDSVDRLIDEYITSEHYANPERRQELLNQLQSDGKVDGFEIEMKRVDGSLIQIAMSATIYPERGYFEGVIIDTTDRKRAEAALENRIVALTMPLDDVKHINFEDLFNLDDIQRLQDEFAFATGVASIITHSDGTPITRPSNFCDLCEGIIRKTEKGLANCYKSDAVIGRLCSDGPIIKPCMSGGLWDAGAGISVGGRHIANWLIGQVRDQTQTEDTIRIYAREIGANEFAMVEAFRKVPAMPREQFEKVAKVLFTLAKQLSTTAYQNVQQARFITARKRVEASLRESESNLQSVFDAVPVGISFMENRVFRRANKNWCDSFGYPEETLIGKTPEFLYESKAEYERVGEKLYGRPFEEEIVSVYTRLKRSDGEFRDVIMTSKPLDYNHVESGTAIVVHDVTELKRAEEEKRRLEKQLQQAQKMESIGTLAGGIAHDFNNLLMAIQGRASVLLMDKNPSHPDFEFLKGIEGYVGNAADLTNQLLGFARGGKYEVKPTDLNKLIRKDSRMFGRTKKEISIREKYEENLWSVAIDRGQIQQVLLNLYVNAWQAMPGGGDLYIETKNVILDEKYVEPFLVGPGNYVKISITDTGVGMDQVTQEKIFDPFFTTKEMGRGTGLGLASAYGIIKNHGGFINVYSEKGHGSTFGIYLPVSAKAVIEEKNLAGETLRGGETILFVDDEDMVTETAEDLLGMLGYNVLTAESGKEAIEIYKEDKEQIGMVILDMVMPGMGGGETYDRLKDINPKVKVLLSSGYSIDGQATEILNRGCNGFIQKPFKVKGLSQKIREILDKK